MPFSSHCFPYRQCTVDLAKCCTAVVLQPGSQHPREVVNLFVSHISSSKTYVELIYCSEDCAIMGALEKIETQFLLH